MLHASNMKRSLHVIQVKGYHFLFLFSFFFFCSRLIMVLLLFDFERIIYKQFALLVKYRDLNSPYYLLIDTVLWICFLIFSYKIFHVQVQSFAIIFLTISRGFVLVWRINCTHWTRGNFIDILTCIVAHLHI